MSLGANIKQLRHNKGWTQGDLSKASGVKIGHVSKLERDDTDPKLSTIYRLMDALECSADALLRDSDKVGVAGELKAAFERAEQLPDAEKATVIDVIDKYCQAVGMMELMDKRYVFGVPKLR